MQAHYDLLIRNGHYVSCESDVSQQRADLGIENGRVKTIGNLSDATATRVIDASGQVILPGLVDAHTHLVFGGNRIDEFEQKMAGVPYSDIAKAGGGIQSTVRQTREASDEQLFESAKARLLAMVRHGVTTVEIKSGYGLDLVTEMRMLRVARKLGELKVAEIKSTFLGAHTIPKEAKSRSAYVDLVVEEMLPHIAEEKLASACDVYCDQGAFTLAETERILRRAQDLGLFVKAHAGQFADLGCPQLIAQLQGLSADHLESVSDAGLRAMSEANVIAVMLPGAFHTLRQPPPDVERMRNHGVRFAVATDANPGTSPTCDLPLCAALMVRAGLTPTEATLAITSNAAHAVGAPDKGRIYEGGPADLAVYSRNSSILSYALGGLLATATVFGGRVVHEEDPSTACVW